MPGKQSEWREWMCEVALFYGRWSGRGSLGRERSLENYWGLCGGGCLRGKPTPLVSGRAGLDEVECRSHGQTFVPLWPKEVFCRPFQ